ncbi:MAG: hypothetical protein WCC48_10425 [Anaeromyxobacteraceae bacterium]
MTVKKGALFLILLTHLAACSLFTKGLAKYLYSLYRLHVTYEYADWTKPWVHQEKPMELMWFVLSFAFLYCCLFGWAFVYKKLLSTDDDGGDDGLLPLLLINSSCLPVIGVLANRREGITGAGVAASAMLFAVMILTIGLLLDRRMRSRLSRLSTSLRRLLASLLPKSGKLLTVVFVVAVLLLSYDLLGLAFGGKLVLTNEFVEVSEETIIDGKPFDNHEFIKRNLAYPQFSSVNDFLAAEYAQIAADQSLKAARKAFLKGHDPTVKKFMDLNANEFKWQLMNRSFDLHNNQTMNPLNAWMLGVPLRETHNLYGLIIPTLSRLYFRFVHFSYDNWLRLAFFLEWIYFISIPVGIYFYTRSKELAFAVFVTLAGVSFYGIYQGYFYLVNAQIPINPIRHGLDFLAMIALGMCVKRRDTLSVALLGATCVLAIMLGDHFGLATTAASAITLFILYLSEKRPAKDLLMPILVVCLALASFKYSNLNDNNPSVAYFLDGYFSWPARDIITSLLFFYSFIYLSLFYLYNKGLANRNWYLVLFLALYSNMLSFHYVWHGVKSDFVAITVLSILVPCLLKLALDSFGLGRYGAPALLAVSLATFPVNYHSFRVSKNEYYREVQGHTVYQWNLEAARFKTTMPPGYFSNSIDLIKKYSANDDGIYMISKYDYMLPVLARKRSRMLYPNLPYFLVTSREVGDINRQLEAERPKFIFVDSDVMLDGQLWTVNNFITLSTQSLFNENQLRLSRLNELKNIFLTARDHYQLVEKGRLIDVYARRDPS